MPAEEKSSNRSRSQTSSRKKRDKDGGGGVGRPDRARATSINPRQRSDADRYSAFRKNLALLDEALDNRQFELGTDDIRREDLLTGHQANEDRLGLPLRTNWGDGTSGDYEAVLGDSDNDDLDELGDGDEYGLLISDGEYGSRQEAPTRRRRYLQHRHRRYAETPSGRFKPMRTGARPLLASSGMQHGGVSARRWWGGFGGSGGGAGGGKPAAYERYRRWVAALEPFESASQLLIQGLLAGVAAVPYILSYCADSDTQFLTAYRPVVTPVRRLLFVLTLVAGAAAVDALNKALRPTQADQYYGSYPHRGRRGGGGWAVASRLRSKKKRWKDRSRLERLLLVVITVLYLAVFLASSYCSIGDAVIAVGYEQHMPSSSTPSPTVLPSHAPSHRPSQHMPSFSTPSPTALSSQAPSHRPSPLPSSQPTQLPSPAPSRPTELPSPAPSQRPSGIPTAAPSQRPSGLPSAAPSQRPSGLMTGAPSQRPSGLPSAAPSPLPSAAPTVAPSRAGSSEPTRPTAVPTGPPSPAPTTTGAAPTVTAAAAGAAAGAKEGPSSSRRILTECVAAMEVDPDHFEPLIAAWYACNAWRFYLALTAWVLVAVLHLVQSVEAHDLDAAALAREHERSQRKLLPGQQQRELEAMNPAELLKLHEEQRRAYDLTASLLNDKTLEHQARGGLV